MRRGGNRNLKDNCIAVDNQPTSHNPSAKPKGDTPLPSPPDPTVEKTDLPEKPADTSQSQQDPTNELRREFKLFEILSFAIQVILAAVGIGALCIYSGQLKVMQGTLEQMRHSGSVATDQTWQAIGNMNWLARGMDESVRQTQQAVASGKDQSKVAMEASAAQSKAAIDASVATARTDQRAWVGIVGVDTIGGIVKEGGDVAAKDARFTVQSVSVVLRNSGRTPSLKMSMECCFLLTRPWRDPIPDYDSAIAERKTALTNSISQRLVRLRQQMEKANPGSAQFFRDEISQSKKKLANPPVEDLAPVGAQGGVLSPDIPTNVVIVESTAWGTRSPVTLPQGVSSPVWNSGDRLTIYILGKVIYTDIFKETHSTKFCLMRTTGASFFSCPEGNWMD